MSIRACQSARKCALPVLRKLLQPAATQRALHTLIQAAAAETKAHAAKFSATYATTSFSLATDKAHQRSFASFGTPPHTDGFQKEMGSPLARFHFDSRPLSDLIDSIHTAVCRNELGSPLLLNAINKLSAIYEELGKQDQATLLYQIQMWKKLEEKEFSSTAIVLESAINKKPMSQLSEKGKNPSSYKIQDDLLRSLLLHCFENAGVQTDFEYADCIAAQYAESSKEDQSKVREILLQWADSTISNDAYFSVFAALIVQKIAGALTAEQAAELEKPMALLMHSQHPNPAKSASLAQKALLERQLVK